MVVQQKNINLCKTKNFKNAGSVIQNQKMRFVTKFLTQVSK